MFILADDLGYGDVGVYGNVYAETPNLDRMAREGTMFLRTYASAITCCPSRVALMTGRYPWRYSSGSRGLHVKANGFQSRQQTLTSILQDAGYRTMHAGKWHIGPDPEDGTYGIDTIEMWDRARRRTVDRSLYPKDAGIVDNVMGMLEEGSALGEQPFYIQLWSQMTHFPASPPDALVSRYQGLQINEALLRPGVREKLATCSAVLSDPLVGLRNYIAEVYGFDQGVGQVLDKIDALQISDETVVIFSSDHGAAPVRDDLMEEHPERCNMMGCSGPFSGGKHELKEGGIRYKDPDARSTRIRISLSHAGTQCTCLDF